MTITITTSNLNGIRASERKGFEKWVARHVPDVMCMQELRAPQDIIDGFFAQYAKDYEAAGKIASADRLGTLDQVSDIKGRAGVAIVTDLDVTAKRYGLPGLDPAPVDTGRWIEADVVANGTPLTVVCIYDHAGDIASPEKMDAKYRFLDAVMVRMKELADAAADGGNQVVVAGDFNIAHTALDIKDAAANEERNGFTPRERAYVDRIVDDLHYVDVTRKLAGDVQGPYTWWTPRGHAYENDAGWRIDYQFATPGIAGKATAFDIDRTAHWYSRWSDHAPLTITYDI
ncbi:exodeoxyribonuclease III [Bifidobacterium choloepi]|uniref:Exodeoxyribonuclease III n=1 Tax=Bifidobacterium choloepi TaxID=2614131 RepID=A0A6I5NN00_9BIFI|nr:exodeoxyribonuclease III [Bifidobacterium choloepi]NEG70102.1 exodeoxyribonuclease III [Bifidobacterium choloepi]